jgi:hypothetical protein
MTVAPFTTCVRSRKKGFASRREAKRHLRRQLGPTFFAHHVYRCKFCGLWHMTSQEQRQRQAS